MRYGSIGWSVGAALGYAFASGPKSCALSAVVPNGLDMAEEVRRRPLVNPEPSILNGSPQTLPRSAGQDVPAADFPNLPFP